MIDIGIIFVGFADAQTLLGAMRLLVGEPIGGILGPLHDVIHHPIVIAQLLLPIALIIYAKPKTRAAVKGE